MSRRARYAVGIVIVVLSLSLPHLLLAQDDLTLESLAETVQELTSEFKILTREISRINDRLEAVENTQVEPNQVEGVNSSCLLSSREHGSIGWAPLLRTETVNAYLSKYGSGMETFWILDIRFHPEEKAVWVRYAPSMRDEYVLEIIEKWRGCKFLGFEFTERFDGEK